MLKNGVVSVVNSVSDNKSNVFLNVAGGAVGGAIGIASPVFVAKDSIQKLTADKAKLMSAQLQSMMPEVDTFENTQRNITKLLEDTGLKEKGVKFFAHDGSAQADEALKTILQKEINSNHKLDARMGENLFTTIKYGANACFLDGKGKNILCNTNLHSTAYHELGHALNANTNIFSKSLVYARRALTPFAGISIAAPLVLAVGLLHKPDKSKPSEDKGKREKTLDFVSNHAGAITLASYVPMLAEEGLASIRGVQQAKKVLSPDKISKLANNYMKAFGTYAMLAGAVSGGVALGVWATNKIKNIHSKNKQ